VLVHAPNDVERARGTGMSQESRKAPELVWGIPSWETGGSGVDFPRWSGIVACHPSRVDTEWTRVPGCGGRTGRQRWPEAPREYRRADPLVAPQGPQIPSRWRTRSRPRFPAPPTRGGWDSPKRASGRSGAAHPGAPGSVLRA
jgi:hypothetical protein